MSNILRQMRADHWAWVHAKMALLVWATLFWIFTPATTADFLGHLLVGFVASTVIIGVLVSILGLIVSFSNGTKNAARGIDIELFGLWMAYVGPLCYAVTQAFLVVFTENGIDRLAVAFLGYAIASLILVRIVVVLRYRKRGR